MLSFGQPGAGAVRAWSFSPDGRWFAYVYSPNGSNWFLRIVALQNVVRANGTTIPQWSTPVSGVGTVFTAPWNNGNFGWAGSNAVTSRGITAPNTYTLHVACPLVAAGAAMSYTVQKSVIPGQFDWAFRVGPCGEKVALVPLGGGFLEFVSTATAALVQPSQNNVPWAISGAVTNLTTQGHGANSLLVSRPGGNISIDDPECFQVVGGVRVRVDRVKASTLPNANQGIVHVGEAFISLLPAGQRRWAKVPNINGWGKGGESHWCLLAQAIAPPVTPPPWNPVSPFPGGAQNCAQRNIFIA